MRTLVTGGAGFIGSHLVDRLLKRGDEVVVIDDLSTGSKDNVAAHEENPRFTFVHDSILNRPVLESLILRSDLVLHLAAAVGVKYVIEKPLHSLDVNVRGSETLLELAAANRVQTMIFSTSEIYGKSMKIPFREDDDRILGPVTCQRWNYSIAKALDEILALAYHRERGLPAVIVRCFNTCGPRQTGQYGMVVPRFVEQALNGAPLTVYGDGSQSRCFGSVFDVADGVMALLEEPRAVGEIFNLGSDEEVTILSLAYRVKELTASRSEIRLVPYDVAYEVGFEDMQRRVPDLSKIGSFVGYRPKRTLDEILQSVIDDVRRRAGGGVALTESS
jgi:UDP-glucose 4-epimerase